MSVQEIILFRANLLDLFLKALKFMNNFLI